MAVFLRHLSSSGGSPGHSRLPQQEDEEEDSHHPLGHHNRPPSFTTTHQDQKSSLFYVIVFSSVGNILEWIDFSLYAFLAPNLGIVFFPPSDTHTALLQSFSVFAGAFLVRPVGGLLFGWIGDVISKKFALQLSIILMAASTTLMGLLPGYKQIGLFAPIILTLLRLLQGLAVGGQLVGTMVFINHHAPHHRKGFYGGLALAGASLGTLVGSLVGSLLYASLTPQQLQSYGFRIPFLCGWVVALAASCLHSKVPSEVEEEAEEEFHQRDSGNSPVAQRSGKHHSPLRETIKSHKIECLLALFVTALWCICFYVCFVWLGTYFVSLVEKPLKNGFALNSWWLFCLSCFMPFTGHLADLYGCKKVMASGAGVLLVLSTPCFYMMRSGSLWGCFFGQGIFTLGTGLFGGPLTVYLTNEATTSNAVFTAVALIYNIAQASFGGVAPLIATALSPTLGGLGVGCWMSGMSAVCLLALRCSGGHEKSSPHHEGRWLELKGGAGSQRDQHEGSSDEEEEETTIYVN